LEIERSVKKADRIRLKEKKIQRELEKKAKEQEKADKFF